MTIEKCKMDLIIIIIIDSRFQICEIKDNLLLIDLSNCYLSSWQTNQKEKEMSFNYLSREREREIGGGVRTLFLKLSITLAAEPVQLINIIPTTLVGCAKPNLAQTFAPAPSPKQITYLTCKKFNTDTRSSPRVCNVGNWNLKIIEMKNEWMGAGWGGEDI